MLEGARWYLTPTDRSSGILYDRLQRAIAGLGARPQAIDAATHDRVMATVSHIPHVIANALVREAARRFAASPSACRRSGTSFRDTTRVAGANPAIWGDIFASNRDAVADGIDAVIERLGEAAALIRAGDPSAVAAWHAAAGDDRRRLLEAGGPGASAASCESSSRTGPAPSPRSLSRSVASRSTSRTWRCRPRPTCARARSRSGSRAMTEADRAAATVRELGHTVTLVPGAGG